MARAVLAALSVFAALPFAAGTMFPGVDLPQHLAMAHGVLELLRGNEAIGRCFEAHLAPEPYSLAYALILALGSVLGVEIAGQIVLAASAAALPWSVRSLARAAGADVRASAIAVAFVHNRMLYGGFVSFVVSLPLLFFALAAAARDPERPPRSLAVLHALLFLAHLQVAALFWLVLAVDLAVRRAPIKVWLRHALLAAPAFLLSTPWLLSLAARTASYDPTLFDDALYQTAWRFDLKGQLVALALDVFPGPWDAIAHGVAIGALVLAAIARRKSAAPRPRSSGAVLAPDPRGASGAALRPPGFELVAIALAAALLLYIAAPLSIGSGPLRGDHVFPRFGLIALMLLPALAAPKLEGARLAAARVAAVLALIPCVEAFIAVRTMNARYAPARELVSKEAPEGLELEPWMNRRLDGLLTGDLPREAHAYLFIDEGGIDYGLYSVPQSVLRWKPACAATRREVERRQKAGEGPLAPYVLVQWPESADRERLARAGYQVAIEREPWLLARRSSETTRTATSGSGP